jgi:hypothetical protein
LFVVDKQSGRLTRIGSSGFDDVDALSFRSADATLWGWARGRGLIRIDLRTGAGTLVFRASSRNIEGLAWSNDGARLYGTAGTDLWVYDPARNTLKRLANNLPGDTEALDMRPDGRLVGGIDKAADSIFVYDVDVLRPLPNERITTRFNDIEGIAWPESCAPSTAVMR